MRLSRVFGIADDRLDESRVWLSEMPGVGVSGQGKAPGEERLPWEPEPFPAAKRGTGYSQHQEPAPEGDGDEPFADELEQPGLAPPRERARESVERLAEDEYSPFPVEPRKSKERGAAKPEPEPKWSSAYGSWLEPGDDEKLTEPGPEAPDGEPRLGEMFSVVGRIAETGLSTGLNRANKRDKAYGQAFQATHASMAHVEHPAKEMPAVYAAVRDALAGRGGKVPQEEIFHAALRAQFPGGLPAEDREHTRRMFIGHTRAALKRFGETRDGGMTWSPKSSEPPIERPPARPPDEEP